MRNRRYGCDCYLIASHNPWLCFPHLPCEHARDCCLAWPPSPLETTRNQTVSVYSTVFFISPETHALEMLSGYCQHARSPISSPVLLSTLTGYVDCDFPYQVLSCFTFKVCALMMLGGTILCYEAGTRESGRIWSLAWRTLKRGLRAQDQDEDTSTVMPTQHDTTRQDGTATGAPDCGCSEVGL